MVQPQVLRQVRNEGPVLEDNTVNQGRQILPQLVKQEVPGEEECPPVMIVNRNQDVDQVVHQVRQGNLLRENNLATIIERIMAYNGVNMDMQWPNYISPISEFVLQTKLPRGWKVPEFIKFVGDTNESTVEHIARYLTEADDIANNENLSMRYFPSSITKKDFTWFTALPAHSISDWSLLERLFHKQFYMGQSKISLKELSSVKRKLAESIDDYLNRFQLLKIRCFTQVPEHEIVKMIIGGLDYSIRKILDMQYLRDMAQLDDRVRQVKRLKAEKARVSKGKKERVDYVDMEDQDLISEVEVGHNEESEVDVAELKPGPPYVCKLLTLASGKNPSEHKENDKFSKKTYTFDVTKCNEIFDFLVADGQVLVPPGTKVPPLEQSNK